MKPVFGKLKTSGSLAIGDWVNNHVVVERLQQIIRRRYSLIVSIRMNLPYDVLRANPLTELAFELSSKYQPRITVER